MRQLIIAVLLSMGLPLWASTTLHLHLTGSGTTGYQGMSLTQGPIGGAGSTSVTATTASGTSIQGTATSGGSVLAWMSEPIASSVTLSGTETLHVYAKESATTVNATVQLQLFKYSGGVLGAAFCTASGTAELTASIAEQSPTCTATSTTFNAGDQIVAELYIINVGTMAAGTVTIEYDYPISGSTGDTQIALAETATFNPVGGSGGTPALVQVASDSDYNTEDLGSGSAIASGQYINSQFSWPVGAGNLLLALVSFDSGAIPTISDLKGNAWYLGGVCNDTSNDEEVAVYYAPNVIAGTQQVRTTYHASNQFANAPAIAEWTNVATANPIDGGVCAFANSATVAAGSYTPHYANDLVVQYAWNEWTSIGEGANIGVHYTQGSQTGITWQKFLDGWDWGYGAQWGVYSLTTALDPTMTVSAAGFNTVAVFFRSASAGTPQASGIHIVARHETAFMGSSPFNTNPLTVYPACPSNTNLVVANYAGPDDDMTGVSDSNSNSWSSNHAHYCDSGNNTCVHTYSASNATVNPDMSITLTMSAMSQDTVQIYCIAGAATSAYDTSVVNSGNETTAGNLPLLSITPSTADGLVLLTGTQTYNTTASFAGTSENYDGCFWSAEDLDLGGCAANNAWGNYLNPNTSAVSWTSVLQSGTEAVGVWAAEADSYKAAASSGAVVRHRAWVIQ